MRIGINETINLVKSLDQNMNKYYGMAEQEIFTDDQRKRHLINIENFEPWLLKIINS
jgi:hypothetical protein